MSALKSFTESFLRLTSHAPFPWQTRLYEDLVAGKFPEACKLPTGMGKTSIIPIWLLALVAAPAVVPRRLIYVVNRRTVVDQATDEAANIRKRLDEVAELKDLRDALGAMCAIKAKSKKDGDEALDVPLAISTLRGQFADNGEWCANPARPAIIVGTVDMIGSRLLFSGYRLGFKTRPLQAGFLGMDALLVHDEAHLEHPFQKLIESIKAEQDRCGDAKHCPRPFRAMTLTATPRTTDAFELDGDDFRNAEIDRRLNSQKGLELHEVDAKKRVDKIIEIALKHKDSGQAILVYAQSVKDVLKITELSKKKGCQCLALTGTMRGLERDNLTQSPIFQRFLAEGNRDKSIIPAEGTVYLVSTSAGEVGVNISADHLVCDLSMLDSMIQRFGRVNRFGLGDADIDVVYSTGDEKDADRAARLARTLEALQSLPIRDDNGRRSASPKALGQIKFDPDSTFARTPEIHPTTDILFDAWALTTIAEPLPGRPPVDAYLNGVEDKEEATTEVVWRKEVRLVKGDLLNDHKPKHLLDAYPIKPHEVLQDRSYRVLEAIKLIAKRDGDLPAWVIDRNGEIKVKKIQEVAEIDLKRESPPRMILLPPEAGGLESGLLDGSSTIANDVADEWYLDKEKHVQRRLRTIEEENKPPKMRRVLQIKLGVEDGEGDDEPKTWSWFERPASADYPSSKTARCSVSWDTHTNDVMGNAVAIATALGLNDLVKAVRIAAQLHDMGKKRKVWQRSIGNFSEGRWLAKSGRNTKPLDLSHYRHEFGSLLDANDNDELRTLSAEEQDLVLHLIAVHHGYGRPHFPEERLIDPEHSHAEVQSVAAEVPRRFARLQRKYGRWGLAYIESLLRAADYYASANPSKCEGADDE